MAWIFALVTTIGVSSSEGMRSPLLSTPALAAELMSIPFNSWTAMLPAASASGL